MKFALARVLLTSLIVNVVFGIPLGILINFFPTIPTWLIFAISIIGIPSFCYFLYIKYLHKEASYSQSANFIKRNKISICVGILLASWFTSFFILSSLNCSLMIDNGTIKTAKIEYYSRTKDFIITEILSDSSQNIILPKGENIIIVNGKKKLIHLDPKGQKYIFNIDKINNYKLFEIEYGKNAEYPRELESYFSTEFFKVSADYFFDAPESIRSQRGRTVKKTVLMRFNNTNKEVEDQTE